MADWRLDQRTEETPTESDITILSRGNSTFKTTFKKIKEFIIGTTALTTTDTTVTGAIEEVKEIADNNTTQLNENTQNISNIKTKITATEGTFQPIIEGTTAQGVNEYSIREGKYKLINGICYFSIKLGLSVLSSGNTGYVAIKSLPYACTQEISMAIKKCYPCKATKQLLPKIESGNIIWLYEVNDVDQSGGITISEIYSNTLIEITGSYFI